MSKITILGLGLTEDDLTRKAERLLHQARYIILHTGRIGASAYLEQEGIPFRTLDDIYESTDDFDEQAEQAADAVLEAAEDHDVVYGVIDVRDESVIRLLQNNAVSCDIIPGVPVDGALTAFTTEQLSTVAASDYPEFHLRSDRAVLIREIDNLMLASEVKLKLSDVYPAESAMIFLSEGNISHLTLEDLDRVSGYDHRCCALILPTTDITKLECYSFDDLIRIVSILHSRKGCPWDKAQTHQSMKPCLIEEAYEVADAIDRDACFDLADELGDVLFEVVTHAKIAEKTDEFDLTDVTTSICQKMIRRHPKIFHIESEGNSWTETKMREKGIETVQDWLASVSKSLPALIRANKVRTRIDEALNGESIAVTADTVQTFLDRFVREPSDVSAGTFLYTLCAFAASKGIDPEAALQSYTDTCITGFANP